MAGEEMHADVSLQEQVRLLTLEKSYLLGLLKEYLSGLVQAEGKLADFRMLLEIKEAEIGMLRAACKGTGDRDLRNEMLESRALIGELKRENGDMRALLQAGLEVGINQVEPMEEGKELGKGVLEELAKVTQERNILKYDLVPKLQQALHLCEIEKSALEQRLNLPKKPAYDLPAEPPLPTQTTAQSLTSKPYVRGGYQPLSLRKPKRAGQHGAYRGNFRASHSHK